MPRLKNSRKQTKKAKQKSKQKLVVAMVSRTSLRSQKKQATGRDIEKEAQSESDAKNLRPKRAKPVKRLIEEEVPQPAISKKKSVKKGSAKGKKKKIQSKASKRKTNKSEAVPAKRQKVQEDVEEMGAEFEESVEYNALHENAEEILVVATKTNQTFKHGKSRAKRKVSTHGAKSHPAQIVVAGGPGDSNQQESEDDDDLPEEDDDDIDDSLFFGIPAEKSPEVGICTHCKKKFHRDELPAHLASCPERYVQCRECNKVLSNLQTLERHHKRFHLKLREVPCTLCDKMFIDEAASRKHLKTVHFKVKNFHCPHCDKSFSQRNKLTYHVRTHSGEKPFSCPECGRAFSLLWNLKTHLRTHTGEKPYSCEICGRKFTQKQNMTSHMTTHKKPKLSSNSYVAFSTSDNMDYFSMSDLGDSGKATMVPNSDGAVKLHQSRNSQGGHYLIDQIGNITPANPDGTASGIAVSQGNDPENGLGLLSSVARKGESSEDFGASNVEVDGIVDETHLTQHLSSNPAIDQVVEVLVQPQGGQGDAAITLTPPEVSSVGQSAYIGTSRVGGVIETSEVFQNKESSVVTASASSLQQQQQVMNAQNVIPIGNANLSGLANILQNPEVLAAINAAAASNKFIVIGPVGMLSGANTSTTSNVSFSGAYSSNAHLGSVAAETIMSEGGTSAPSGINGSNAAVVQMQANIDSGIAAGHCNVEMIAADTSQDSPAVVNEQSNEKARNEVQSSASNFIEQLVESSAANDRSEGREDFIVTSEEVHVESSQDTDMQNVITHNQHLDGEVSSSAASHQSATATLEDTEAGDVQSTNIVAVQSSQVDNVMSSESISGSEADVYYTVHQGNDTSDAQTSNQLVVTLSDQFVSSSSCTTSMASESFIASNAMTGSGQSMVMVTADGKSYITTVGVTGGLVQNEGQQVVLTTADANSLNLEGTVASTVNLNSNEASCVLLTTQLNENQDLDEVNTAQSSGSTLPQQVELSDFTVTDSTARTCDVSDSAASSVESPKLESNLVCGSSSQQPDSGQSKIVTTMASDSTVDSQADSIIESSHMLMVPPAAAESHSVYSSTALGNGYEAQQSAVVDGSSLLAANSSDSVVSGTENFISHDLQKTQDIELEKTGVTSSRDLLETNAECTSVSVNTTQDSNNGSDHEDSQVSTSLQV